MRLRQEASFQARRHTRVRDRSGGRRLDGAALPVPFGQMARQLWRTETRSMNFLKNGGVLLCSEMFSDDFLPKVDLGLDLVNMKVIGGL